jgi:hypothetical protein
MRDALAKAMPALFAHEGLWDGTYRHLDHDAQLIDQHRMRTRCEFPANGAYAYVQHNHLIWPDTDRFYGHGWETRDNVLMLTLHRKDEPGVRFTEMIQISDDGESRARTWQWFRDGNPFRRTLCDERRISRDREAVL